ncbi:MAG: cupin domain-containing protein [Burkholderiaceae bacterium]|nr:MAG: cupin domain-containing protein [Burkholderiaceae bacterium]
MEIMQSTPLLGGLSPAQFMRGYWQKKPLLIRAAVPGFKPLLKRPELFALAARDDVESRLLQRAHGQWMLAHGPLPRRALPPIKAPNWTLLVQGVDALHDGARALLERFRFVPDARLDDLMISYATPGGGVGPHFDSYDVFLLQVKGRRRWRIGQQRDLRLKAGLPLKILAHFEPQHDWVLEPGDMLYLPPRWAHDGVAVDECMTYSIGFRSPAPDRLASELLYRLAEQLGEHADSALYKDAGQPAVPAPGAIPERLVQFAQRALSRATADPKWLPVALGRWLTEPKANVWFQPLPEGAATATGGRGVVLDRRSRMLYLGEHVFINGEVVDVAIRDRAALQRLADERRLDARDSDRLGRSARKSVDDWLRAGWLHVDDDA